MMMDNDWIKTTCPYCGVGCGVEARALSNDPHALQLEVRGDASHPSNFGRLCSKGLALADTVGAEDRLLTPMVNGAPVSWEIALSSVAHKFSQLIAQHGADAVAFYASGQLLTEDYYIANKLMKGFIGSANIDTNSRLCMSSSVAGHKRAFGSDTVPGCYQDLEIADTLVLVGSNLAWCHPVLFQRIKAAKQQNPQMQIIVIDPRHTDSCAIADLHLPITPGSDVTLFNGLLQHLNNNGLFDHDYLQQHVDGWQAALDSAADYPSHTDRASALGLTPAQLSEFYRSWSRSDKVITLYSQGVNQSSAGVDKVNSIINCHLASGRIGRPGMGPFSITGQPNAMGGREVGGLANMLAAHMDFSAETVERVQRFWHAPNVATQAGAKAVDLFERIHSGQIKAVWIMATNPAVSLPDANRIREALQRCELVVVSDCVANTDTLRYADIALPAQGWSEKSGTVTNSERRISRQRRLLPPLGEAKPDWWILCEVAKRMGFADGFNFSHEAEIFAEHAALSGFENGGTRDFDISGYADQPREDYEQMRPFQWPAPDRRDLSPNRRFFADGRYYTANQRAQMIAVTSRAPASATCAQYPLVLNSGRIRDQWHTMTRTGRSTKLSGHIHEPFVSVHPDDAKRLALKPAGLARLSSAYGQALLRVEISHKVKPGQLFVPIHWSQSNSALGTVSALVSPETDPISGQPESKFTPVAMASFVSNSEAMLLTRHRVALEGIDYWVEQRIEQGYLYTLASALPPAELAAQLQQLEQSLTHADQTRLEFSHADSQHSRLALLGAQGLDYASIIAPALTTDEKEWLQLISTSAPSHDAQRSLLSGVAQGQLAQGKQICACKQVGRTTLCDAIEAGAQTVEQLSACTGAGTGCGSCLPELEQLLEQHSVEIVEVA